MLLDDNKTKIAKSGALVPLTRLARSKDMRVQRNATGALLNMTHSGVFWVIGFDAWKANGRNVDENRQQLVNAGAIPVLVSLLNSSDTDVQYYCTTALSNIAVDGKGFPCHQERVAHVTCSPQPQEARADGAQACHQLSAADG